MTPSGLRCLIVGAGPGGLASAAMLERAGFDTLVVERGDGVAAKWKAAYDRLHINTSTLFSYLPGAHFPARVGRWPSRDQLVAYYERYAREHGLAVQPNTTVQRVERAGTGWRLITDRGDLDAPVVVVATGKDRTPTMPDWPGRETFDGELLHTAHYRNAAPYRGRDALVVGSGNSALDVCLDLAGGGARSVRLSVRRPPHITRRSVLGVPSDVFSVLSSRLPDPVVDEGARRLRRASIGDLSAYGLPEPRDGLATRLRRTGMIPTIDPGQFVPAVKAGRIDVVAAVESFDRSAVVLEGGRRLSVDVVIAATGYRQDLEPLVGHLGVLDGRGRPEVIGGATCPQAPGLYFIGFGDTLAGNLRQLRLDAQAIADHAAQAEQPDVAA